MSKYLFAIVFGLLAIPTAALACPISIPPIPNPPPQYAIQVLKYGPAEIVDGTFANYRLIVRNVGQLAATNAVITDTAPNGFVFDSGDPLCTGNGNVVTCTIPNFPGSSQKVLDLTFKVPAGTCPAGQTVINGARLSSSHAANNTTSVSQNFSTVGSLCVNPPEEPEEPEEEEEKEAKLEITKTDNRTMTRPTHGVIYDIVVKNTGDEDIHDVVVVDSLPGSLTDIKADGASVSGNTVTWSNFTLNAGETKTFTVSAKVKSDAKCSTTIANTAVVRSDDHGIEESASDDDTLIECQQVKGAIEVQPKQPVAVPVTARTGAGLTSVLATILGGTGLIATKKVAKKNKRTNKKKK